MKKKPNKAVLIGGGLVFIIMLFLVGGTALSVDGAVGFGDEVVSCLDGVESGSYFYYLLNGENDEWEISTDGLPIDINEIIGETLAPKNFYELRFKFSSGYAHNAEKYLRQLRIKVVSEETMEMSLWCKSEGFEDSTYEESVSLTADEETYVTYYFLDSMENIGGFSIINTYKNIAEPKYDAKWTIKSIEFIFEDR